VLLVAADLDPVGARHVAQAALDVPGHLPELARPGAAEVSLALEGPPTVAAVLDAVEERWPVLTGTIRDPFTRERRAYIRYFACGEDISHESPEEPLPAQVAQGREPLRVVGAISGG